MERRALQVALALVSLIPVFAGLAAVVQGPAFFDATLSISGNSMLRYLSGLLLGIGLTVWAIIPRIEENGRVLGAIAFIVAVGGLARLWSLISVGTPRTPMVLALFVELILTPALYLWQRRVARATIETRV